MDSGVFGEEEEEVVNTSKTGSTHPPPANCLGKGEDLEIESIPHWWALIEKSAAESARDLVWEVTIKILQLYIFIAEFFSKVTCFNGFDEYGVWISVQPELIFTS